MKRQIRTIAALLTAFCLAAAACAGPAQPPSAADEAGTGAKAEAAVLAAAQFPVWPQRSGPDKPGSQEWEEMNKARTVITTENRAMREQMAAFAQRYCTVLMQGDENVILSPATVWLSLAMLAEVSAGDTQAEILAALECESLEECRAFAQRLVQSVYIDDGVSTVIPVCAAFLSDCMEYRQEPLAKLAEVYMASAFSGTMGSAEYDAFLQAWLDESTGGMLTEEASAISTDPTECLALASAVVLKTPWAEDFAERSVTERTFDTPAGPVRASFMSGPASASWYVPGDGWRAAYRTMQGGMTMWFVLPDEETDPARLMEDPFLAQTLTAALPERTEAAYVTITVPMFDASSAADIAGKLPEMGITLALDGAKADFSPLLYDTDGVAVSKMDTAARVKIDTAGVEAASFSVIHMTKAMAAEPLPQVELTFDRPFFFAVTGPNGVIVFAGLVNSPVR